MAQWIWYPGDFEFFLGQRVMSARREWGAVIPPNWRMESVYHSVQFRRTVTLSKDTYLKFDCIGSPCVLIQETGYLPYDEAYGFPVPQGTHSLHIFVYSADRLPALYLDHPEVQTDEGWEVTCDNVHWLPVGCWNFTDRKEPPTAYGLASRPISWAFRTETPEGALYDFGSEVMACPEFQRVRGRGRLLLSYGESREEALDYRYSTIRETLSVDTVDSDAADAPLPSLSAAQAVAFRYVLVRVEGKISFEELAANFQYLPIRNRGSFHCEDPLLNQIYETSVHTFHLCSREFFLDGIKRDRWVWSGDATQSYLINFYSFFDNEICKRTMRLLRGKDPVTIHLNTIQDYTLYWFISLSDYYLYTGDLDFIREIYPSALSLMEQFCLPQTDSRGFLMAKKTDWVFIDWGGPKDMNQGDVSFIQILFAQALKTISSLARLVGDTSRAKQYGKLHADLLAQIFKCFWSEELGCFLHGTKEQGHDYVTRYSNMFAILFGYLQEDQVERVRHSVLLNEACWPITTPYMKYYELLAMGEAGLFTQMHQFLTSYWGGMLGLGCTTFWETYDPSQKGAQHYAMYGRPYGKSLCHAWGAGPIILFGRYYLGVRPTSPGYQTFLVEPHPNGLTSLQGTVPTPGGGSILVSLSSEKLTVDNRSDGCGKLHWQGQTVEVKPQSVITLPCQM